MDCPSLLIPLVNEAFQTDYPLDADARIALRNTYRDIFQRLSLLEQGGEITEFTRQSIKAMIDKVAIFRAGKYAGVKKEVKEIMGGQILNYEAKDIRNSGIREGEANLIIKMYKNGFKPEQIASAIDKSVEEIKAILNRKSIWVNLLKETEKTYRA